MSEPIISFKNVSKTYILYKNDQARFKALFIKPRNPKTNRAFNDVSFEINRGESVGIVGDNGAGKSTLLKMITGVAFPDEGEIFVDGKVAALLELTAGFSMDMTGRENIYLKGYILGLEDDYIKEIEENIIEFAELGDYIDQPVRTYSSGMKVRLGFAINVNISPDILVIDEALAVGDASFKRKCKDKIKEIIEAGTTVLYVSHTASSVKEICPRSIYLRKGAVIYDGDTEETLKVYNDYKESVKNKKEKMIKTKLNEFEADWAALPVIEKDELIKLKNKTILISGHSIARCLCYALLYQNDAKALNIRVIFSDTDNSGIKELFAELVLRDDFDFVDYNSLSEIRKADYIIYTGLCGEEIKSFGGSLKTELAAAKELCRIAKKSKARLIALSDSRVYGKAKHGRVYAENEYARR